MAFTKVRGRGVTTTDNYTVGVITATKFVGPIVATDLDINGNADISGNLTVGGDFTTLNTTLREVELLHVDANSSATAGIITQRGSGNILDLYDTSTNVLSVKDGGVIQITKGTSGGATANTDAALIVDNSSHTYVQFRTPATKEQGLLFGDDADNDAGAITYNHSTNALGFRVNADEKVRILSTGNVGIGLTNPGTKLEIKGTAATLLRLDSSNAQGTSFRIRNSGTDKMYMGLAADFITGQSGNVTDSAIRVSGALLLASGGGDERIRLDSSGRLLVGTDVAPASSNTLLRVHTPISSSSANSIEIGHNTNGADKAGAALGLAINNGGASTNDASLYFSTATNGSLTQKLWIKSDGSIEPASAGTQDLGSTSKEFRHIYHGDSGKAFFGLDQDLSVYHNNSHAFINNSTGNLNFQTSGNIWMENQGGTKVWIKAIANGQVELYHDNNVKTFSTESWGNTSYGQILKVLAGEGTDATLQLVCDDGDDNADLWQIFADASHGGLNIQNYAAGSWETNIVTYPNSSVDLNYDNALRLKTSSTGITVTGEVAATQDYPNYRSTIDFNFTAVKKLDPRITYVRTGAASYIDEMGKVVLVGANVPRFDHDPETKESKGLLIEPSRTNLFPYGTTPGDNWSGSKAASTWTENTTEVKAPDGTYTATKWAFTGTDPYLYHQGTLSANTTYTISVWVKAGTNMSGDVLQLRMGAAPYSTFGNSTLSTDGSWKRLTFTKTVGGSDETNVNIGFEPQTNPSGNPASGDVVYIWGAQLEVGGYASSLIPTNGATATRGGDFVYLDGTIGTEFDDIYRTDEGTFIVDWFNNPAGNHNDGYVFTVDDGTGNNRIGAVNSNNYQVTVTSGGSSQGNRDLGSINSGANKMAFTYKLNDQATSLNGSDASVDTSCTLPTGLKYWWFGCRQGQYDLLGGYISRIVYYPTRLPNSQLKTLSS